MNFCDPYKNNEELQSIPSTLVNPGKTAKLSNDKLLKLEKKPFTGFFNEKEITRLTNISRKEEMQCFFKDKEIRKERNSHFKK